MKKPALDPPSPTPNARLRRNFTPQKRELNFDTLRNRLKVHSQNSELALFQSHPEASRILSQLRLRPGKIRDHAVKLLSSGALAGTLLLSPGPAISLPSADQASKAHTYVSTESPALLQLDISQRLKQILPPVGQWNLSPGQEAKIRALLQEKMGIATTAEHEGNRLPNSFGRMGAEQHLPRYPGDTAAAHGKLIEKGITPGLGGWGYVSDHEVEKWYVAVPIIYLPDWRQRVRYYVDWYKFRRMAVINPANGKVVITAVADAGPANWTGKHFGGSPEVMEYLGINYGMQNHPVVMFFLDDPNREIPLGPLEYNIEKNKKDLAQKS